MAKSLKVPQIKSGIGCPEDQKRTLKAVGLGKMHATVDQVDNDAVRGMLFKVKHLVEVVED